jgi:hypothetical protein
MVLPPAPRLKVQDLSRWSPPLDWRNPITVLQEHDADLLSWLVPVRHSRNLLRADKLQGSMDLAIEIVP